MVSISTDIRDLDEENNQMWDEIRELSAVLPEGLGSNVSINDRQSFFSENARVYPAEGKHAPSPNLITSKDYRGP